MFKLKPCKMSSKNQAAEGSQGYLPWGANRDQAGCPSLVVLSTTGSCPKAVPKESNSLGKERTSLSFLRLPSWVLAAP